MAGIAGSKGSWIGGLVNTLFSIGNSYESGRLADGYRKIANRSLPKQQAIANQLRDWGNEDWDEWMKTFAPAEEAAVARATEGFKPQTDRVTGQVAAENARAMNDANEALDTRLSGRAVNPASGGAIAARAGLTNAGAANTGFGINVARTGEANRVNDANWDNRLNLAARGSQGLSNQALMLTKASDVINVGARRAAGLSDQYSNIATAGLNDVGRGVGQLSAGVRDAYNNRDINTGPESHEETSDYDYEDFSGGIDSDTGSDYADGGLIVGPGTGTSDSIPASIDGQSPAAVSNGEYRIPAAVVARIGRDKLDAIKNKYHNAADRNLSSRKSRPIMRSLSSIIDPAQ